MNLFRRPLTPRSVFALTASLTVSFIATGCGVGSLATGTSSPLAASPMHGTINGGPNPIKSATITIYTTGNVATDGTGTVNSQGYGQGTALQTATSDASGNFTFAGGFICPAGQFAYLTSSGGDTGAGVNGKAVLVAALGRCDDLYSGTTYTGNFVFMNELTTVAAAYALNNFAVSTGQGSSAVVGIGAPATNNNAGVGTKTAAAGLRHAFQNAAALVRTFPYTETANTVSPFNSSAQVPAQLINTLADVTVACINSNGSSAACTTLFGATGTSTTSGNTFTALLNLVKNPSLAGSGYTSTQLINAASPATNFYQPVLTSAPNDFTVAILYPKGLGAATGVQGLQYPVSDAIDTNDDVFIGNYNAATSTSSNAVSFLSNGALVSFTPNNSTNIAADQATVDAAGSLYFSNGTGSPVYYPVSNSTGAIGSNTGTPFGTTGAQALAADRANNVWVGYSDSTFREYTTGGSTQSFSRAMSGNPQPAPQAIAVDPDQNIWVAGGKNQAHNSVEVQPNTGLLGGVAYSALTAMPTASLPGSPSSITFNGSSSPYEGYISINAAGVYGLQPVTPTLVGNQVTGVTAGTEFTTFFTTASWSQADGSNNVWTADGSQLILYNGSSSSVLSPCIPTAVGSNTTCKTSPYSGLNHLALDSTGAVWFTSSATGSVSQVIGSAAPTWPLLSAGVLGKP